VNTLAAFSGAGMQGIRLRKKKQMIKGVPRMMGSHERETFWVFREVTTQVDPGQALVMVSRDPVRTNALLRVWAGILPLDEGEVQRPDRSLLLISPQSRWVRELSVEQTIRMLGAMYGLSDSEIDQILGPVARTALVDGLLHRVMEDLGKQIRDQIAFAVALHAPVPMVMFDHTTSIGTRPFREKCLDQVVALREAGKAVVVVTEKPQIALQVGTHAVIIKGKRSQDASVAEAAEFLIRQRVRGRKKARRSDDEEEDDDSGLGF
jgi:ABC-2 type transport system ATP-binding protein